jgi:glycosyltransferase
MTLLTVVTVVKDDPDGLAATLTSVPLSPEIQIVVIDSSADDTAIQTSIASRVVTYHWAAPEGVYPAMNIGIAHATGDYVYFLNAGDTLIDGQLSLVLDVLKRQAPTWFYAYVAMTDMAGRPVSTPRWSFDAEARHSFSRGLFPCHQATIVRRDQLERLGGFDTSYRIVADYELFLRLTLLSQPEHLDLELARFAPGGVSTVQWRQAAAEFHRARREVLRPRGRAALDEAWHTRTGFLATWAYRTLWAPGRPLERPMRAVRG